MELWVLFPFLYFTKCSKCCALRMYTFMTRKSTKYYKSRVDNTFRKWLQRDPLLLTPLIQNGFEGMRVIVNKQQIMGPKLNSERFKCFSRGLCILTWSSSPHNANLLLRFDGEGHLLQNQREIFLVPHLCILKGHLSFLGPIRGGSLVLNSGRCFQRESLGRQKGLDQADQILWGLQAFQREVKSGQP